MITLEPEKRLGPLDDEREEALQVRGHRDGRDDRCEPCADEREQRADSRPRPKQARDAAGVNQATTPADVYAVISSLVRPSTGGAGLVVLLCDEGRLAVHHDTGYEGRRAIDWQDDG